MIRLGRLLCAIVVGAGIGGLATAISLERAGIEPVERVPELREAGFGARRLRERR
jgi:2-polyprenyl-6-methoxyphenol hydroxylase-like FAD-dependent oxidoreductase